MGYLEPEMLIVPQSLYDRARFLIYSKKIRVLGRHILYEFDGKFEWRTIPMYGNTECFPKFSDETGIKVKTTRAMRKRNHPKFYYYDQWNDHFTQAKVFPF